MGVPIWQRSKKERVWLAVANVCLCAGIVLGLVLHPAGQVAKDWMDGVRGLLIGLSIGMNLMLVIRARRGGCMRASTGC